MQYENEMNKLLKSLRVSLHDQVSAVKEELQKSRKEVSTMLELSADLEGKTVGHVKILKNINSLMDKHQFLIDKTLMMAQVNALGFMWVAIINNCIIMENQVKIKNDWLTLSMEVQKLIQETQRVLSGTKIDTEAEEFFRKFDAKLTDIERKFDKIFAQHN